MSKYQPESQAANVSAKRADSNGIGKGRGRAGPKSRLARNDVPLVSTCTLRTAASASSAAGAQALRASSRARAACARALPPPIRRVSHDGRGIAARRADEHQQHQERLREAAHAHEAEVDAARDEVHERRRREGDDQDVDERQRTRREAARASRCGCVAGLVFAHPQGFLRTARVR